jgi:flavin reductase (DIM6/NTAB) family NADH-FMN oxidoreductase RutF
MHGYEEVSLEKAYALQNAGGLVLVCTAGRGGVAHAVASAAATVPASAADQAGAIRYDLAPVAWCCPLDNDPVSKILLVCDTAHRTYADLRASGEFALALPSFRQKGLVLGTGSVSGNEVDKYASLGIAGFRARMVDALIPEGVAGWLECRLGSVFVEGTSAIVTGEVLFASAHPDCWRERLHYVDDSRWFSPGNPVD